MVFIYPCDILRANNNYNKQRILIILNTYTQRSIIAIAILTTSSGVISKEISYTFIEGTYASITDSSVGTDIDANGFGVAGSFNVAPFIALTAGYSATSYDTFQGIDVDFTELTFGITAHASIAPGADIVGSFSVLKINSEVSDGFTTVDDDETGNIIGVGFRFMPSEVVELDIGLSRVDAYDDKENTFGVGARFYANEKFSLGIGYRSGDDVDALLFNARIDI